MKKDEERSGVLRPLLFTAGESAVPMHVHVRAMLVDVTGSMATDDRREQHQSQQSTDYFHAGLLC